MRRTLAAAVALAFAFAVGCGGDADPGDVAACLEEAGFENVTTGPSGVSGDRFGHGLQITLAESEAEAQGMEDDLSTDLLDTVVEREGTTVYLWDGDPGDEARATARDCG